MRPRVSVIIPAYCSEKTLPACLDALHAQTFHDFETILVNSSPEGSTGDLVTRSFPDVRFFQSPHRLLPHAARNAGAKEASGELLVFTDPDCFPEPDWLARLVQRCDAEHPVIMGSIRQIGGGWFQRGVYLCKYAWGMRGLPSRHGWIASTANACYARVVWQSAGPFSGELWCGDALLSWRANAHGYQPWFEPQAAVVHQSYGGNLRSLWNERSERGQEFARVRAGFERWPRWNAAVYASAFPLILLIVLVHGMRDAIIGGEGLDNVLTLPVSFVVHLAWNLGETRAFWQMVLKNSIADLTLKYQMESRGQEL
jgi:glycosyltransferase involved in cell wall biosynthesis